MKLLVAQPRLMPYGIKNSSEKGNASTAFPKPPELPIGSIKHHAKRALSVFEGSEAITKKLVLNPNTFRYASANANLCQGHMNKQLAFINVEILKRIIRNSDLKTVA